MLPNYCTELRTHQPSHWVCNIPSKKQVSLFEKRYFLMVWWKRNVTAVHWQWNHSSFALTHWGWVTHICIRNITIIGSDNGLSPGRHQAIIWTNAGILLIRHMETNCSEISIEIYISLFKKMHLKMSSGKWQPFYLSLNVLNQPVVFIISPWHWNFLCYWESL